MQDYINGGLKMTDIYSFIIGLKSSWIKIKRKILLNKKKPMMVGPYVSPYGIIQEL